MKPHSLVFANPLKQQNSCAFTTKVPILKRDDVIGSTAVRYSPTAVLLKINMTEPQKWNYSLFIDNATVLGQGY
jgi:hypothetical protein